MWQDPHSRNTVGIAAWHPSSYSCPALRRSLFKAGQLPGRRPGLPVIFPLSSLFTFSLKPEFEVNSMRTAEGSTTARMRFWEHDLIRWPHDCSVDRKHSVSNVYHAVCLYEFNSPVNSNGLRYRAEQLSFLLMESKGRLKGLNILFNCICFATIEPYHHLLDFKMCGIVERRLTRPNALCCNVSKSKFKLIHPATRFWNN